ncbi:MAG: response regulator [Planctomycetes bacterium]|nr:response regulator [Planctomycetota bacterium]
MSNAPESIETVLIADNDPAVNSLLVEVLKSQGLHCESVFDGGAAWQRVIAGGVAVLVTDLDMPEVDGRELVQRIAGLPDPPRTLVVSGYLDAQLEQELRSNGVLHVLRKPFDVMEFAERVRGALKHAGARASDTGGA